MLIPILIPKKQSFSNNQDKNNNIYPFIHHSGATVTKIPVVAKLPLDLYRLYHVVDKLGGFAQVCPEYNKIISNMKMFSRSYYVWVSSDC